MRADRSSWEAYHLFLHVFERFILQFICQDRASSSDNLESFDPGHPFGKVLHWNSKYIIFTVQSKRVLYPEDRAYNLRKGNALTRTAPGNITLTSINTASSVVLINESFSRPTSRPYTSLMGNAPAKLYHVGRLFRWSASVSRQVMKDILF